MTVAFVFRQRRGVLVKVSQITLIFFFFCIPAHLSSGYHTILWFYFLVTNNAVDQSTVFLYVNNAIFTQAPTIKQEYLLLKSFLETSGKKQFLFYNQVEIILRKIFPITMLRYWQFLGQVTNLIIKWLYFCCQNIWEWTGFMLNSLMYIEHTIKNNFSCSAT